MTPDIITVAVIAGGSSLATAVLSFAVTAWLGSKKATNEDARLGLDALTAGLASATTAADQLNGKLNRANEQIVRIERQAYRVLSENNRFRIIHGQDPAHSLDSFEPLPEERWREFVSSGRK